MRRLPPLVRCLGEVWHLERWQTQALWKALMSARWSQACELKRLLVYYNQLGANEARSQHVLETLCTPQHVLGILEALVQEKRLTRSTASQIEDALLRQVDARGQWQTLTR